MAELTGPGKEQMRLLTVKAHAAGKELKKQMRGRLKQAAEPIRDQVRAGILNAHNFHSASAHPTARHGRPGYTWHKQGSLRAEIAKTVNTSVSIRRSEVTLDIVSAGRRMPAGKAELPVHTDMEKGWGHPVFGRGPRQHWTWVREWGEPHWFENAAGHAARDGEAALRQAMEDVKRMLE